MDKAQVLEWLKKDENKSFLGDNGFQTTVEKKVEVPTQITDELVTKFIGDNQGYRDKLHNQIETDFLKRKTGLDEIKPEMLGEKLFFESGVNSSNENYKKALIGAKMGNINNSELLLSQLDNGKISFVDGKLEGFDEQLTGLKEKYPSFFEVKNPITPKLEGEPTPPNQDQKILDKAKETGNTKDLIGSMIEKTKNKE